MQILKDQEATDYQKELDEQINIPYEALNYHDIEELLESHITLIEKVQKEMDLGDQDSFEVATHDQMFDEKVIHQAVYDKVYSKMSYLRSLINTSLRE